MKKLLLLIIILTSFYGVSSAQHQLGVNIAYGIPYYNIVNNNNNSTIEYTPKELIDIEFNYKKRWPGTINFGSSISYQYQSSQFNVESITPNSYVYQSRNYQLNYINIKVFPEFIFGEKIKFYFQIGPSMSFMVYSDMYGYTDVSESINGVKISTIDTGTATDDFDIINFLIFGGLGLDYPINENLLVSCGVQFQYNINSWFAREDNAYSDKSLLFKLGFGYKLNQVK